MNIIPLIQSHFSFGKSLITLDEVKKDPITKEVDENRPISIFHIAQKHNLKEIFLCDSSMSGFVEAWKNAQKYKILLRFGYKVICCDDITDKSESSLKSEHKVIIWLNDSEGYKHLVKLVTKAQVDGFYYVPRIDSKNLENLWNENLSLACPFYDSYIHNNTLTNNLCVPKFPVKPTLFLEDNDLPIDSLIRGKILEIAKSENLETQEVKSVYFYAYKHFKAYNTLRAIMKRGTLAKSNLNGFSSDRFCFEDYLEICPEAIKNVQ